VGDRRVADGVDHLGAVLDDAVLLVGLADHVAGGVLQEDQRRVRAVGQLDELGCLLGLLAEQHAARVGQHPDRVAVDAGPGGDQRRPVQRLELVDVAVVDHARQDVPWVEGHPQVGGGDREQALLVVPRWD